MLQLGIKNQSKIVILGAMSYDEKNLILDLHIQP